MTPIRVDEFGRIRHEMDRPVSFKRSHVGGVVGGGRKLHPKTSAGDRIGPWTIVRLLGRVAHERSNERVEAVCDCGRRRETFVYDLRKHAARPCVHRGPAR